MAVAAYEAAPAWSVMPSKRGLDPLGMQAAGIVEYQGLLPGISNVTLRMRYYGLYAWLADTYAAKAGRTDNDSWRRWVRRTEALYALIAADAGVVGGGVAGVDWAGKRLKEPGEDIDFAPGTEPRGPKLYLKQNMGVFGGAYGSQLREVGVLGYAAGHDLPVPTQDVGLPLAQAFRAAIGEEAEALAINAIQTARIARPALAELRGLLPSAISPTSDENSVYGELLFDAPGPTGQSRRDTLQLILGVARVLGRMPDPADVRWTLFEAPAGAFGANLEPARLGWEAYHAHDLMQLAFAGLLRHALDVLGATPLGLPGGDLVGLASSQAAQALAEAGEASIAPARAWGDVVADIDPAADVRSLEKALSSLRAPAPAPKSAVAAAVRLIAAMQARVEGRDDLAAEMQRRFRLGTFGRALTTEVAFLQTRKDKPLAALISDLIALRVINRHGQVATQKFVRQRDYTFLFEQAEGRLRRRGVYDPVLTTPRLGPAITFLRDLGMLDAQGPTATGLTRLEAGA